MLNKKLIAKKKPLIYLAIVLLVSFLLVKRYSPYIEDYVREHYGPAPELFPLNDEQAVYTLLKYENGTYLLRYKNPQVIGDWPPKEASAAIGSSQVSLDEFAGKRVKVEGAFHTIYGKPLCWKRCIPEAGHDINHEIIIDIQTIQELK